MMAPEAALLYNELAHCTVAETEAQDGTGPHPSDQKNDSGPQVTELKVAGR